LPGTTDTLGARAARRSAHIANWRDLGELQPRRSSPARSQLDLPLLTRRRGDDFLELDDGDGEREVERRLRPRSPQRISFERRIHAENLNFDRARATLLNRYLPSSPLVDAAFAPTTMTRASGSGSFDPVAVTRPAIVP
jgi:hypothetical protein